MITDLSSITKEIVTELLSKMGFQGDVTVEAQEDTVHVLIEAEEPEPLIGYHGQNLAALKRVARLLIQRKLPPDADFVFDLDVNNYRERANSILREIARRIAERVVREQRPLLLKPMSSYERRVIHLELASHAGVITESIGEEPERRLAVKPFP